MSDWTLVPLADRVLIQPDEPPTQTDSGLYLSEHKKPEQTGVVVAVGGAKHPRKDDACALADTLEALNLSAASEAAHLLRDLTGREPDVAVGDRVIFSWQSGQELWVNDGETRYLLMRERDILAVVEYA